MPGACWPTRRSTRPATHYGFSGPQEVFDTAERLGRAHALDTICRAAILARAASLPPDALLFLNVSPQTLEHGVLHNEDVQVATDYLKARGKGTLDLNTQAIDYYVVAQVNRVPSSPAQGAGGSGQVADLKAAEVPIRITGSLGAMKVRPDIEALARQEVRGQLQQRSDDLKQKLGEKLKDLFGH